jgi:hypothetical protein
VERILGMELGRLLGEGAGVREGGDPGPRPHREVVAALLADPEAPLELVVAVVRVTAGAGVRVTRRRTRLVVGLDRDVDLGHFASLDL